MYIIKENSIGQTKFTVDNQRLHGSTSNKSEIKLPKQLKEEDQENPPSRATEVLQKRFLL